MIQETFRHTILMGGCLACGGWCGPPSSSGMMFSSSSRSAASRSTFLGAISAVESPVWVCGQRRKWPFESTLPLQSILQCAKRRALTSITRPLADHGSHSENHYHGFPNTLYHRPWNWQEHCSSHRTITIPYYICLIKGSYCQLYYLYNPPRILQKYTNLCIGWWARSTVRSDRWSVFPVLKQEFPVCWLGCFQDEWLDTLCLSLQYRTL